ncbi:polycystin-2-like [Onthophagus taurus]|uniref:polycystin-2-like n=1 Tax=Onthophagus taurus TaxID=166361 RepID=UPI000C20F234|nr:polycystin-2-like isoform X1 [Onthophagus taurus]XP_022904669.1 polycystin-2-like isoform X2 [Onthophagus taurus]
MQLGKTSSRDLIVDQSIPLDKIFKRQPQRVKWVTAEIAQRFEREYYLVIAGREFIFYIIFLFCATMVVLGKVDTDAYYMTAAIKKQITGNEFSVDEFEYKFSEIRSLHFFHIYLVEYLSEQLYWTSFDVRTRIQLDIRKDRGVLYVNKLIGQPTLRQVAVINGSCTVHNRFKRHLWDCREEYKNSVRLKSGVLPDCQLPGDGCMYTKRNMAVAYSGILANYASDGFLIPMGLDRTNFIQMARRLRKDGWYSLNTRALFLDFMLYNPNLDIFCGVKLIFEIPAVGGVIPSAKFYTFNGLHLDSVFNHFAFGCFLVYFVFLMYYLMSEFREIMYLKSEYFTYVWTYVDYMMIGLGICHAALTVTSMLMLIDLISSVQTNSALITDFSLQHLAYINNVCSNVQGFTLFFIYIKIFKYFNLSALTGQINRTLALSGRYLCYFSIIFFLVLIAFAEFGYQAYGRDVDEYSSLGTSMFTLIRTILADFNYEKLEKTHRLMAPIFFVLFIFVVFFVLVNMFVGIICGNYATVKNNETVGPEVMQMTEFWKRGFHNLCKSMKCGFFAGLSRKRNEYNIAAEQIRLGLIACGFSELDVDVFMARYKIDLANLVTVKDITRVLELLKIPAQEHISRKRGNESRLDSKSTGAPLMALNDFQAQQQKLDEMEHYITSIAKKIELLLKKMNALSDVRSK